MSRVKVLICCLLFGILSQTSRADNFANPLDVLLADPQVLLENGTYYLYATSPLNGFKVWTSKDLVNWRDAGVAFRATATSWGKNRFWAPEVIKANGKFYLFYSAGGAPNDVMRICVASATSPSGPFTDIAAPLFDDGKAYIDAHVFTDSDGAAYLYCSQDMSVPADGKSEIVVARLNATFTGITGSVIPCIGPTVAWEGGTKKWNEAPFVLKHDGYYFMLYSGNVYSSPNYSLGYAYATSLTGPWTKYSGNPIVKKTSTVSGPGHCAVTTSPDGQQLWLVYHTHQQLSGSGARQLAIDRIEFSNRASGPDVLTVPGAPSSLMKQAPSGIPAFPAGGTDEFNSAAINRNRWLIFNENDSNHDPSGTSLVINTVDGDIYADTRANSQNVFLQYPPWDDFLITSKITFAAGQNYEQASLMVWQDHNNFIRFSNAWIGGRAFEIGVETGASFSGQQIAHSLGNTYWLRIKKSGNQYTFSASTDGDVWSVIGSPVTVSLIDRKIGFSASSPGSARRLAASFDYFRVEPANSGVSSWSLY